MPASAADPVSSVLKNAFASSSNRSEISNIHQPATGLIRGGSSSSVLSTNDSLNHEPVPFGMSVKGKQPNSNTSYSSTSSLNSNSSLENGIRANAKKLLLSSQQCNVEFDEPTRYAGGLTNEKSLSNLAAASPNSKPRIIVLNPNQKQLHINGNGKPTKKVETNGKAEPVSTPKPKGDVDASKLNKALEEGGESVAFKHSKSSSPWTVKSALAPTPALKCIVKLVESISSQHRINAGVNGNSKSHIYIGDTKTGQQITSPSPSSSISISSNSSMQCHQIKGSSTSFCGSNSDVDINSVLGLDSDTPRKQCNGGTADEGDTDYDAEFDKGRTKKVKKTDSGNRMSQHPSSNTSSLNPFQLAQTSQYKNKNVVSCNKARNSSKSPLQPPTNKSWSSHRDYNYQRQWQAVRGNRRGAHRNDARRNGFGANDYKDKK